MDKGALLAVKATIRSLVVSSNMTMSIQDLQKDFKSFMGYPLPYNSLGFRSAEQLLRAIPDVVRISGYGPQALVQYVPNEKSEHIADLVRNQKVTTNKRRKRIVRPRGSRLYTNYTNYISISEESNGEMPDLERLNINDYGGMQKMNMAHSPSISSSNESEEAVIKYPDHDQHVALARQPEKSTAVVSTDKNLGNYSGSSSERSKQKEVILSKRFNIVYTSEEEEEQVEENENTTALKPAEISSDRTQSKFITTKPEANIIRFGPRTFFAKPIVKPNDEAIPEDALTDIIENLDIDRLKEINNEATNLQILDIPQCKLYEELKEGSVISLYISEIHNPLIFFFHINEEDPELIKLEEDMQSAYSTMMLGDIFLPDSYLQAGRFCAAFNDNTWYRAKILDVPTFLNDFSKIKVLFIDYGCIDQIPRRQLRRLLPIFSFTPIQAACGRLAQMKPNDRVRSLEATKYFTALANDRCLYAYVEKINNDTPSFDLILIDTNEQPKRNINECLVKMGLAEKTQANEF